MDKKARYLSLAQARFQESLRETDKYEVKVAGKTFTVYPGVFSPKYFIDTEFFAENLVLRPGENFLEIGCGTGVISVIAALQGANVTATDINPVAVRNARENARQYGLEEQMSFFVGNLFEPVAGKRFDTIFWNMPFNKVEETDVPLEELAIVDPQDKFKTEFIHKADEHLRKNGRLLIGFSSNYGDFHYLQSLLQKKSYRWKLLAEKKKSFNSAIMRLELLEARGVLSLDPDEAD